MLKRLGLGLLKGLAIGGVIGAALHFGLGLTTMATWIGYLVAMGAGLAAAVFSGKPPWAKEGGWIEGILKGVAGLGLGALAYWIASSFAAFGIPIDLAGIAAGTAWTAAPLVVAPVISGVFGAAVELDNTPVAKKEPPKTRIGLEEEEVEEPLETEPPAKTRKQA